MLRKWPKNAAPYSAVASGLSMYPDSDACIQHGSGDH